MYLIFVVSCDCEADCEVLQTTFSLSLSLYHYIYYHCDHVYLPLPITSPFFKQCCIFPVRQRSANCASKQSYNFPIDGRLCYLSSLIGLSWIFMQCRSLCVKCFWSSTQHWWHGNGWPSVEACSTQRVKIFSARVAVLKNALKQLPKLHVNKKCVVLLGTSEAGIFGFQLKWD
jgi:hypothetical protein